MDGSGYSSDYLVLGSLLGGGKEVVVCDFGGIWGLTTNAHTPGPWIEVNAP